MAEKKERLDTLLVEKGLVPSREKAKTIIMSGNVFVNNQREDKAGTKISIDSQIVIKENPIPYVSRGGLKLEKAINEFEIDLDGLICMDVGSSTGGFTDCMLQNKAKKVYSIDVGYGQLDWSLRNDDRVVCMEKTNIRYVTKENIIDNIDFVSVDVSFISLKKILVPIMEIMDKNSQIVCLIKPQFEAGREKVGKKGVVREINTHYQVIKDILEYSMDIGFEILSLSYSPIKGPEGNIEYLLYMKKSNSLNSKNEVNYKIIVDKAFETL